MEILIVSKLPMSSQEFDWNFLWESVADKVIISD